MQTCAGKDAAMREREIVQILAKRLAEEGVSMTVRYGPVRGPDIEGQLPRSRRRFFIEAKGERPGGAETAKRRVAMGEVLLQILPVYDRDVVCAIALPNHPGYRRLVRRILPGLLRLDMHVFFVDNEGIRHLSPNASGFLPRKVHSVSEALES